MRVAYVSEDPGVPVFGTKGASRHAQAVLRELGRAGVDVRLFAARLGDDRPGDLRAVSSQLLAVRPTPGASMREAALREASARLPALLDDAHRAAPFDVLYERYSLWGTGATRWARSRAVSSILEVNSPLPDEQGTYRRLADHRGALDCARAAISAAGVVLAVSEEVADWARRLTSRPDTVHVVPNGVDTAAFTRPRAHGDGLVRIGFVGTLKPWHGLEHLVRAFARVATLCPQARLVVIGDGPQAPAIRLLSRSLGIEHLVELTGAVAPDDVPGQLARLDIGCAPYPALDGFYFSPLKVYEYMAAGLPIVASAIGQVARALDGGRLGVLVAPGNEGELAANLCALVRDPERRSRLGLAARAVAEERHDWSDAVARAFDLAGHPLPHVPVQAGRGGGRG